jgi:hypothetical protein
MESPSFDCELGLGIMYATNTLSSGASDLSVNKGLRFSHRGRAVSFAATIRSLSMSRGSPVSLGSTVVEELRIYCLDQSYREP